MAQINSGAGAGEALTVDPTSLAARVSQYDSAGTLLSRPDKDYVANPGGSLMSGVSDNNAMVVRTDRFGNLGISYSNAVLWEQWENTTLPNRWTNTNTTFAPTFSTTGANLNPTALTTANAVSVLISNRTILRMARNPIQYKARVRVTNFANSQHDFGLADAVATTTQIANGVYFQVTNAGVVQGVVSTASADVTSVITFSVAFNGAQTYTWDILLDDDGATFLVQETATGRLVGKTTISLSNTGLRLLATTHLKAFNRVFNTATPPASAPVHQQSMCYVGFVDTTTNKPWSDVLAGNYLAAVHSPVAVGGVAQWGNSAEPASATLSNTAAGYTTLGGKFQFAAIAGAATDYCLFGYTVPAPYTLVVKSISIDTWNTGAAVATTATALTWGCMIDSTAVSLATANMPRRSLGAQSFAVGAAVGAIANNINRRFEAPLVTHGGRFFCIILRMPVGTATASQVIAGMVDIDGYFE